MAKKPSINDYRDRMTAPVGVVLTDPKTRKPLKSKTTTKKTDKRKK